MRNAMLFARAKPRFSGDTSKRTFGNDCRIMATLPSVDALSTTIISDRKPFSAGRRDSKAFARYSRTL